MSGKQREPVAHPPMQTGEKGAHPVQEGKEMQMEAIVFFVIWLGGALLHTLFDLRIKPVLQAVREESDLP